MSRWWVRGAAGQGAWAGPVSGAGRGGAPGMPRAPVPLSAAGRPSGVGQKAARGGGVGA